jgi:hypothetical protein
MSYMNAACPEICAYGLYDAILDGTWDEVPCYNFNLCAIFTKIKLRTTQNFHRNAITVGCYVTVPYVPHNCVFCKDYALLAIISRNIFLRFRVHQGMMWWNPYERTSGQSIYIKTHTHRVIFRAIGENSSVCSNIIVLGQLQTYTHMWTEVYTHERVAAPSCIQIKNM